MTTAKYGVHIIGENATGNTTLFNRWQPVFNGMRLRKAWQPFETAEDVFNYNYWKTQITFLISKSKYVSAMSSVAPADANTPGYLFDNPYAVPLVTTDRGTYPYQLQTQFVNRFLNHWNEMLHNVFMSYSADDQKFLLAWQSAEGTTGDKGTIHGNITNVKILGVTQPNPADYLIPDDVWTAHKREQLWPVLNAVVELYLPTMHAMINVGNDFEDIDWLKSFMNKAFFKIGYPGHNYNMIAEKWQQEGIKFFATSAPDDNRMQCEGENFEKLGWFFDSSKTQNIKALLASFAAHGGDIINLSLNDLNTFFGNDISLISWINQYLGYRKASDTDSGMIVLRQVIDVAADLYPTVPISTYPVIDPALLSSYNSAVSSINANADYSAIQKKILIASQKKIKINNARITALRAAYPDAAFLPLDEDQDHDAYNSDYGIDMMQNYEKFVYQSYVETDEEGVWRFGDPLGYDGRFGKKSKNFFLWTDILGTGNYQTKITIKYLDSGTYSWKLKYHNGTSLVDAATITNGNSNLVKTVLVTISDMQGGQLCTHSADWIITTGTTQKVTIEQVDFKRVATNTATNTPPTSIAGSNQTINAPTTQVTLAGSGTDGDGTVVSYLWTKLSGTGGSFANAADPLTVFSGLTPGIYQLQLEVTDNLGATDTSTMIVTVNAQAPTAATTGNQTITLPASSVSVNGLGSSPGSGTIVSYAWAKITGTGGSITSPTSVSTTITGLSAGVYVYQLTVTNSFGLTSSTTLTITVLAAPPVNNPPLVNPGSNQTIDLGVTSSASILGTASDTDGTIVSTLWSILSAPAGSTAAITSPTSLSTAITPLKAGVYVLQLSATDDDGDSTTDTIDITVIGSTNAAPVANAGVNQLKTLPTTSATLDGTGSTDDVAITAKLWTFIDGPIVPTIVSSTSLSTLVTGMTLPGDYIFRLHVQDVAGLVDTDGVRVRVVSPDLPPIVIIETADTTIQAPVSSVDVSVLVEAGINPVASQGWSQVTGPNTANIVTPTLTDTTINGLIPGLYQFRFTATDTDGNASFDDIVIIVNDAEVVDNTNDPNLIEDTSFDIDCDANVYNDLPPDKRGPNMLAWCRMLINQLCVAHFNFFSSYKKGATDDDYVDGGIYSRLDHVIYGRAVYESKIDDNSDLPTVESSWRKVQDAFIGYDERIRITPQKIILEFALNKWFSTQFRQPPSISDIYILNNEIPIPVFRVGAIEEISSQVFKSTSSEWVVNSYSFFIQFNFTIYVPQATYDSLGTAAEQIIRNFADKFVAAGITYTITTY